MKLLEGLPSSSQPPVFKTLCDFRLCMPQQEEIIYKLARLLSTYISPHASALTPKAFDSIGQSVLYDLHEDRDLFTGNPARGVLKEYLSEVYDLLPGYVRQIKAVLFGSEEDTLSKDS